MFDFDFDNRLNTPEKAHCLEKIKEGFENQLYWDADQTRVVQKDGKIIMDQGIHGTIGDETHAVMTTTKLKQKRVEEISDLNLKIFNKWQASEKEKAALRKKKYTNNLFRDLGPATKLRSQVIEFRKNEQRAKGGLSPEPNDEKSLRNDPGLGFVKSP